MKRKIALLMASMMAVASMPTNAFAVTFSGASLRSNIAPSAEKGYALSDANTFNYTDGIITSITKNDGEAVTVHIPLTSSTNTYLPAETEIVLNLTNGKFPSQAELTALSKEYKDGVKVSDIATATAESIVFEMTTTNGGSLTMTMPYADSKTTASYLSTVKATWDSLCDVNELNGFANATTTYGGVEVKYNAEFKNDLEALWGINDNNTTEYNTSVDVLTELDEFLTLSGNTLTYNTGLSTSPIVSSTSFYSVASGTPGASDTNTSANRDFLPYSITRISDTTAVIRTGIDIYSSNSGAYELTGAYNNPLSPGTVALTTSAKTNLTLGDFDTVVNYVKLTSDSGDEQATATTVTSTDTVKYANGELEGTTVEDYYKAAIELDLSDVVVTDDSGDVSIAIDCSNSAYLTSASVNLASAYKGVVDTSLSVSNSSYYFEDYIELDGLVLKENQSGSFKNGRMVELSLSNGFKFAQEDKIYNGIDAYAEGIAGNQLGWSTKDSLTTFSVGAGVYNYNLEPEVRNSTDTADVDNYESISDFANWLNVSTSSTIVADYQVKNTTDVNFGKYFWNLIENYNFYADDDYGVSDFTNGQINIDPQDPSKAYFIMDYTDGGSNANNQTTLEQISLKGLVIEPIDEKNDWGAVYLTVYSEDCVSEDRQLVATRGDFNFFLEAEEVVDIVSGRTYLNASGDTSSTMTKSNNVTTTITFRETTPNSLVETRNLDFTVPDGVKISNATILGSDNITNDSGTSLHRDYTSAFEITNDGTTLRLKRNNYIVPDSITDLAEIEFQLELSVRPDFEGDIELTVDNAGASEQTAVIAKAVLPFDVATSTTNINMGYQEYAVSNIEVKENYAGMFLKGGTVELSIVSPYGDGEMGFASAEYATTGDELQLKDSSVKITDEKITFTIERSTYDEPGSVQLSNVKIGTTRSVPYGSYHLALSGDAVINNYFSNLKDNYSATVNGNKLSWSNNLDKVTLDSDYATNNVILQDEVSAYVVDNYVNVVTSTSTLDESVKLTIGSTTAYVGGVATTTDVAPYLSNGRTMVPLRFVSNMLGIDDSNIIWDASKEQVTIFVPQADGSTRTVQFTVGSYYMSVNGVDIPLEENSPAPMEYDREAWRTFVPLNALAKALGVETAWSMTADGNTVEHVWFNPNDNISGTTMNSTSTSTTEGDEI